MANFENFLKERTKEFILFLGAFLFDRRTYDFERLPTDIRISHYYLTLDYAMKGSRHERTERLDRLNDIELAARDVASKNLDPIAFAQTGGNPNAETLKEIFKTLGVRQLFERITPIYVERSGTEVVGTFVKDKLDALIQVRNVVAHTANILNISRTDILEYRNFIYHTAFAIDQLLAEHGETVKTGCIRLT